MQEVLEQQHQHDVDAQHAGQHGQAEALEQFAHDFGVAHGGLAHAGRQVLDGGQVGHALGDFAQVHAGQFDLEVDVARAVVAVDDGRSGREVQGGDLFEQDGAAGAGHGQAAEQGQVFARGFVQAHDDGDLAL